MSEEMYDVTNNLYLLFSAMNAQREFVDLFADLTYLHLLKRQDLLLDIVGSADDLIPLRRRSVELLHSIIVHHYTMLLQRRVLFANRREKLLEDA